MSVRVPRGRRGTAASVVALIGLVSCAAGAVEAVSLAANDTTYGYEPTAVSDFLSSATLGSTVALVVAIVLLVLGVLVLLAGIVPPRRRLIELGGDEKSVSTGLTRRSLRRTLRSAAERVDGVGSAPVDVTRRKVVVKARTSLRRTDGLADRVQAAVGSRLDDVQPRRSRSVRVRLDRKDA